jgi:hypothetical protein
VSSRFRLRGLDAAAQYTINDLDAHGEVAFTGLELMDQGLPVAIRARPGAVILKYTRR